LPSKNSPPEQSGYNLTGTAHSWRNTFSALGDRNFRWFWIGSIFSYFSGQMQQPAQQWLAYELTGSPFKLGLVMAMQTVPMVVLSFYSGAIIDRIQKKTIMISYQICNALICIMVAILITLGAIQYWHLLLASFLNGLNSALNLTARNAIIPELVPREKIYNAIALNNVGSNIAQIAGPALSGVLIAVIGTDGAYYVAVGFTLAAAGLFSFLTATSKIVINKGRSVTNNLKEGLQYLRIHNILIVLFSIECMVTIFGFSYQNLLPIFATELSQASEGYGFMLSAVGAGSLLGSLFIASLGNFKKKGLILLTGCGALGLTLVLFSFSGAIGKTLGTDTGSLYLAIFILVLVGVATYAFLSTSNTLIQMNVNSEFRGRINGIYGMVIGLYPVSMLLAGTGAEYLGAPLTVMIWGSVLTLFMLVMLAANRRVRKLE
jgi:MFS family permease